MSPEVAKDTRRMLGSMSMHAHAAKAHAVYDAVEAIASGQVVTLPASELQALRLDAARWRAVLKSRAFIYGDLITEELADQLIEFEQAMAREGGK